MSGWGTRPLSSIVKPKPVNEILMEAAVRNVRVDGIKVKVCRRIGMFQRVVYLLPECIMETTLCLCGECLSYLVL